MVTERADWDWPRAARLVRERMAQKGLDQVELARRSGVSDATIRNLTRGERHGYRAKQLGRLAEALDWEPGTIERLARGEDPPATTDYLNREELLRKVRAIRGLLNEMEDDLGRARP